MISPPDDAMPREDDNPTRVSGAAQQADADGRRSGHSRLQYDKATRTIIAVDPVAAAERAVIEAAVNRYLGAQNVISFNEFIAACSAFESSVRELLRLRAAREPKP